MTIDEISFAVKNMNTNKSPGPDGLTVEFYRNLKYRGSQFTDKKISFSRITKIRK